MFSVAFRSHPQYESTRNRFLSMREEFGWDSINWNDFFADPTIVLPQGLESFDEELMSSQQPRLSQHRESTSFDDCHGHRCSIHCSAEKRNSRFNSRHSCITQQIFTQSPVLSTTKEVINVSDDEESTPVKKSSKFIDDSCQDDSEEEFDFEKEEKEEDDVYEIEKIIKKRMKNGQPEYYVKWAGFSSSENSWVKKKDIFDLGIISEFERQLKGEKVDFDEELSQDEEEDEDEFEFDEEDEGGSSSGDEDEDNDNDDDSEDDLPRYSPKKNLNTSRNKKVESNINVFEACDDDDEYQHDETFIFDEEDRPKQKTTGNTNYSTETKNFKKVRNQLLQKYYDEFNLVCFKNKLPALKVVEGGKAKDLKGTPYLLWNQHMRKTAGFCKLFTLRKTIAGSTVTDKVIAIELSTKVCDNEERLVYTLAHEMCHAASFLFDGITGHGKTFYAYGDLVQRHYPDIPITTCHSYEIDFKYRWQCMQCGSEIKRHSKSVDVTKQCCGVCRGRLVEVGNKNSKGASAYNVYVKENFATIKKQHPDLKQGEIMKILAQNYKNSK